ncbi:hypothetical protein AURDEDRAFT_129740 [Auricularia subglabra TFB-10046 SS5]|uniref:F-box domain-containing protein n=1 Tax=Auricularia subglabra (strain TFB-10046 / SS5) TaxID=717982 RepID=J0WTX6_AURST|nr:hypothetical protein AURDEDRAFT_129740 [Auricularia subglabra TFB-10046 SS5]
MHCPPYQPGQSLTLLGLPAEMKEEIMTYLDFYDLLTFSKTCKNIYETAKADSKLWQRLPEVTYVEIDHLNPYIRRLDGTSRGADFGLYDIQHNELFQVSTAVGMRLSGLRSLTLHFADPTEDFDVGMEQIWRDLERSAPMLERLSINVLENFGELHTIPPTIFGHTAQPKLVELQVTAVTLLQPVPAFTHVKSVRAAAACIAPLSRGENHKIHQLFPSIRSLSLLGIQSLAAGGWEEHSLARVPFIDQPLDELVLWFEMQDVAADPETAQWLEESLPHVRNATLKDLECPAVLCAFIASLRGPEALALKVTPEFVGLHDVVLSNSAGMLRTATLNSPIDGQHFLRILALPGPLTELSIPGDVAGLLILSDFGNAADLEYLALDVDTGFALLPTLPAIPSVRRVRFNSQKFVKIDANVIVNFLATVAPGVEMLSFAQVITFDNLHLLPVPYVVVN